VEGRRGIGVGDGLPLRRILEGGEFGEFLAPSGGDQRGQFVVVVGEEQEGRGGAPFLPHEDQRDLRAQQQQRGGRRQRLRVRQRRQPFAEGAVADLVVVLQEQHEGGGRQVGGRLAARRAEVLRDLALEQEALRQDPGQLLRA
jgi:hypothetical protein